MLEVPRRILRVCRDAGVGIEVLDLGSQTAVLELYLREFAVRPRTSSLSEAMGELARKRLKFGDRVTYVIGDLELLDGIALDGRRRELARADHFAGVPRAYGVHELLVPGGSTALCRAPGSSVPAYSRQSPAPAGGVEGLLIRSLPSEDHLPLGCAVHVADADVAWRTPHSCSSPPVAGVADHEPAGRATRRVAPAAPERGREQGQRRVRRAGSPRRPEAATTPPQERRGRARRTGAQRRRGAGRSSSPTSRIRRAVTEQAATAAATKSGSFLLQIPLFVAAGLSRGLLRVTGSADAFESVGDDDRLHGITAALLYGGLDLGKIVLPIVGGVVAGVFGIAAMLRVVPAVLLLLYLALALPARRAVTEEVGSPAGS